MNIKTMAQTATVFIVDHLMNKCHLMLLQIVDEQLKKDMQTQEEYEQEQAEIAYENWLLDQRLDEIDWAHPDSVDHSIPTGDAALDDWCSEMEECLIAEEEEIYPTEELTDLEDDESILSVIDFTEEVNLDELYYDTE